MNGGGTNRDSLPALMCG